jgi:hypothetical protein
MKLKNPIANLFRGGKGGPTGQIGSVNPALRTRRPGINQPVEEVSLPPPPAEIQEILNQNRPLTPAEQAMVNSWQRNAGNAFRWRTQARPGANWTPDPYTGPVPGAIPPNTGSGYNPNWNASGAVNQDQLKNSFSTPKYQQRVDHIAGGSAGGWPGAR